MLPLLLLLVVVVAIAAGLRACVSCRRAREVNQALRPARFVDEQTPAEPAAGADEADTSTGADNDTEMTRPSSYRERSRSLSVRDSARDDDTETSRPPSIRERTRSLSVEHVH
eukprot:6551137-Prymnesium_polylepis.1